MNGSGLVGLIRTIAFLTLTFSIMPIQRLGLVLGLWYVATLPLWYHGWACWILGMRIVVRGKPSPTHPTLFVSNHSSYFDIPVLASLFPCSFIAKADMIGWPLIGQLAKLQRSVFVDRKPANVSEHSDEIARRLKAGDSLVLFAEGTTSDGNRILPFKSSLLSVAENAPPEMNLTIQPVSIIATRLDGMPLGRAMRPLYAWYGDMPLAPHAWAALKAGRLTIEVEFHEPFKVGAMNRKQITRRCQDAVERGVVRAVTGRGYPEERAPDINTPEHAAPGDAVVAAA
ncbi:MAG TPA: lysophospholipid acyltransferase family protein [Alphaproteobacteria bacterium]|jgi:1-acyl-sn-glycerol-3-phosphate acyltransferase|nr:lysophospholipid acyltransferase family protein [Alphaproteobacteria bacterium]